MNEDMNYGMSNEWEEKKSPESPQKKKTKLIIVACIIAVLCIAAVIATCVILSRPKMVIYRSISDAVEELSSRPELEPLVKVMDGGSISLSATSGSQKLDGKLYFDLSEYRVYAEDVLLKSTNHKYTAEAYLGLDGAWFIGDDDFINGEYGLDIGGSAEDWEKYCKDNQYSKDEVYYMVFALLQAYDSGELSMILKDIEEVSADTTRMKLELALEHGVLEEETAEKRIGDKKMKVRTYCLVLDEDALESIDRAYYDYLENNEAVRDLLSKYEYFFVGLMGKDSDKEDIDDLIEEAFENARDNIDYEGETYTIELTTKAHSSTMLEFSVEYEYESKEYDYEYDVVMLSIKGNEKGIGESDELEMVFFDTEINYAVKEDTKRDFIAELEIDEDIECVFKYDKQAQTYSFVVKDSDDELFSIKGKLVVESDTITISVNELIVDDVEFDITGEIVLCMEDKMPNVTTDTKSIFEIKEDQVEDLIENLETQAEIFFQHNDLW